MAQEDPSPRIFAYGGKGFRERRRIGVWPGIAGELLGNDSGIPDGGISIGCVWMDERPSLIIRQLQRDEFGRKSIYNLLLDPGDTVWECFGWNPAALALAVLEKNEGFDMLLRPEDLVEETLRKYVARLQRRPIVPVENEEFSAVWIGSALATEIHALGYGACGLNAAVTVDALAGLLEAVKLPFRMAEGWLIGGTKAQARAFGARVAVNHFDLSAAPVDLVVNGHTLSQLWLLAVQEDPAGTDPLAKLPTRMWETKTGVSPTLLRDRAQLLSDLQLNIPGCDAAIEKLDQILAGAPLLTQEIRHAAQQFALAGEGPINPSRTHFIFSEHLAGKILEHRPFSEAVTARLDLATVMQILKEREMLPRKSTVPLPPHLRINAWKLLFVQYNTPRKLAELLHVALPEVPEQDGSTLLRLAIGERAKTAFLTDWTAFFSEHPEWKTREADWLAGLARQRVADKGTNSPRDYVVFGLDPGGHRLAGTGLNKSEVGEFVAELTAEVVSKGELFKVTREWLAALAGSPLRDQIPLKYKLDVAALGMPEWRWLWAADQLYDGNAVVEHPGPASEKEEQSLIQEFIQLSESRPERRIPQLLQLAGLFRVAPEQAFHNILRHRVVVKTDQIPNWLVAWEKLGKLSVRDAEASRLSSKVNVIHEFVSLHGRSIEWLVGEIEQVLFGEGPDTSMRERWKNLYNLANGPENKEKFEKAFSRLNGPGERKREEIQRFVCRYWQYHQYFKVILILLPLAIQLVALREYAKEFKDNFWRDAIDALSSLRKGSLGLTGLAVLRYLCTKDGEKIGRDVAAEVFGEGKRKSYATLRHLAAERFSGPFPSKIPETADPPRWSLSRFLRKR
jgi:hypothetical protein